MITGAQIRSARAALSWSARALAERSGVSLRTLLRFEQFDGVPPSRSSNLMDVQKAFETAGVEFIGTPEDAPGIRIRRVAPQQPKLKNRGDQPANFSAVHAIIRRFLNKPAERRDVEPHAHPDRPPPTPSEPKPKRPPAADLQALFGPPALLEGEDLADYRRLEASVRAAVTPRDVLEEIWTRDFVDLFWETLRLRRLKAKLMRAAAHDGLRKVLQPLVSYLELLHLVEAWAQRDLEAVARVNALLAQAGLGPEAIAAQTLLAHLDAFERIDHMIMQTEARRNMVLREIDRHRDVLARRLREISATIEDAEFTQIAAPDKADS